MPAMFAIGAKVIGNPNISTFAAFGSFALLLLVDFGGPLRDRLQAQAALALTGGVFVCLGTLASSNAYLAAVAMAVVGFLVIFAGVVSSVLAGAIDLAAIGVHPAGDAVRRQCLRRSRTDSIGWTLAAVAWALIAIAVLWPAPARDPLRTAGDRRLPGDRHPAMRADDRFADSAAQDRDAFTAERDRTPCRRPRRRGGRAARGDSWPRRTGPTGLTHGEPDQSGPAGR